MFVDVLAFTGFPWPDDSEPVAPGAGPDFAGAGVEIGGPPRELDKNVFFFFRVS